MQKILIFLVTVLIVSCSDSKEKKTEDPAAIHLEGKELLVPSDSLGVPKGMVIVDSIMIFYDVDGQFLFKMVNLKTQQIMGKFGLIGRGPGEFPKYALIEKVPASDRQLGIYSPPTSNYSMVNLDSILKNNHYRSEKIFGRFDVHHNAISILDSTRFIGTGLFKKRYMISSADGGIMQKVGEYPYIENFEGISQNDLGMAMQGKLKVKPDGKKFVMAYYNSPTMEIYKILPNTISKESYFYRSPPKFTPESTATSMSVSFSDENIEGYRDAYVTDDYIYLLYSGRTMREYGREAYQGDIIHVYNWDGEKVGTYSLARDAHFIAVDAEDRFLYALSYVASLPKFFYYKL